MTRFEIQQKAVDMMKDNSLLLLQWATGCGKSKAAIEIIKSIEEPLIKKDILLVVAEIAHKKNWEKEFIKWNLSLSKFNIIIVTYASLKKYKNKSYDLIILDEAHHAGSDIRLNILTEIKAPKVLALSATLTVDIWYELGLIFDKNSTVFKITLQEAIDWNILPEPKIYLIPMELDNINNSQIIIEEWGNKLKRETIRCSIKERWSYIKNKVEYPNIRLEIYCTELQKYIYLSDKIDFYKKQYLRTRNDGVKKKLLLLGSERKRYLGSLKNNRALQLIKELEDKRYIVFCSSIEQAEALGGNNSIHSQKKGALDTIDDFNSKKIDSLFTVGMLQEGQNLVDIEAGVIIQLDGTERSFIQKSGRAMRAEEPSIYILYYKNTRDEEYLNKIIKDLAKTYVEIKN